MRMSPCAWWRAHRACLLQLWGVRIACSLLVTGTSALGHLEFLEDRTLDRLLHVQGQRFPSEVVIVAIDDPLAGTCLCIAAAPLIGIPSSYLAFQRGGYWVAFVLPAETMAARLNEYFAGMTAVIFAHRGMINDFVGDAILAILGAPLADPDQALQELNQRWEAAGLPTLRMGIALHTGEVFAGNVGGAAKLKYGVVGHPVNLTARLDSLNKDLGTTILMTEEMCTVLGDWVETRDCGETSVKGRTQPVHVYEVLAVHPEGRPAEGGS